VGDEDRTVPNTVTQILFDKANEPKEFIVIKGLRHKYKNQEGMVEKVNKEVVEFLGESIK
jgi:alpha-beta hydrolase superfamily lysophospholipase